MPMLALPAVFMRGGTSRAVMFHRGDLPDQKAWDPIFLAAMGSPDPNGRQLNGMGGGISSLSKICVLSRSEREDADIDYTFAQIQIREAAVDYRGNCGNMSSAVGPFSVDEGLVRPNGDTAVVRIFNTNTKKIIRSTFALEDGKAKVDGDLAIPGVAGTGAPVRLDFLNPGGAGTGKLLPTGNVTDRLDVPGVGSIEVSMVDAAKPCIIVRASDIGLTGTELPEALDTNHAVLAKLEAIRRAGAIAMGLAANEQEAAGMRGSPAVGFVAPAMDAPTLSGEPIRAADVDLTARFISNGQPHRALPVTSSLCTSVAACITGTVVNQALSRAPEGSIRLGMPSGILTVGADVGRDDAGAWVAHSGAFYRTCRRLFDGRIYAPV
ncbi:MAG TPA: PrpF domain-containing protein [Rhodopila sp.]|uniref:2-methylaconitate cis-trans isomerase PrpF family protein n=1 Tax=Rhodopila sp. TaxID=2480087 RepID=UPI002C11C7DB|nr:PrpF domain-containing protein [Rhodopila sp.]HVY14783.1 PrpF domain-containing protein [Rhodopila sp.]